MTITIVIIGRRLTLTRLSTNMISFGTADGQRHGTHERLRTRRRSEQQHVRLVPRALRSPRAPQAAWPVSVQLRLSPEGRGPSVRKVSKLSAHAPSLKWILFE